MTLSALGIFSAAGAGVVSAGSYELISSTILGSAQSSVVFDVSSYASTYKHLQIRGVARDSDSYAGGFILRTTFNSSSSGYAWHVLFGNGSSAQSQSAASQTWLRGGYYNGGGLAANSFGVFVLDILDPFSTTKNKTTRSLTGTNDGISLLSGLWANTSAVSTITLTSDGVNFVSGSRFSIYGLKG